MKSAAGLHGDFAGETDVVVGDEFAGFENHFQVRRAAGFFRRGDFVEDFRVVAGEEGAAVNDHVHFIRAIRNDAADFFEFGAQRILAAGKCRWRRRRRGRENSRREISARIVTMFG